MPGGAIDKVYPSGADFATSSLPMLPPAPRRGSTTKVWPNASENFGASQRAIKLVPPVPKGITRRTLFDG